MDTMILSNITGEPVKITFAMVGKGKAVHYSPSNDETLCGKSVSRYVSDNGDASLCKPCARIERVRSEEYAEYVKAQSAEPQSATESVSDMIVSDAAAELSTMIAETLSGVIIMGDEPNEWAPDFDASSAAECYFGCGAAPVAVFVDYVGRTEGVCTEHRDRVEGKTYDVPDNGTDERMTMVHRGAHMPSCDWRQEIVGAPVSMVAAELTCPKCISELSPTIVTAPKVHAFPSTGEAYNASQCMEEIKDGDILTVPSEGAVAILVKAWPVAVTEAHGEFHGKGNGMADAIAALDAARVEDGSDYSASLALAESAIRTMREVMADESAQGESVADNGEAGFILATVTDRINDKVIISRGQFPADWDDAMIKTAVAIEHTGNGNNGFAYVVTRDDATGTGDASDVGFVEVLTTKEYDLSVIVDDITGATVSLGWVTLTMNAAQSDDVECIAEEYGRVHGSGTPRDGWASIIIVHDVCDL